MPKDLQISLYIPFCIQRCSYCVHPVVCVNNIQLRRQYMEAMTREFESLKEDLKEGYLLRSIYITGGTPTIADHAQLKELLLRIKSALPCSEDLEISMETVPGSIGVDPFASYRKAGIQRFDLGVCTTHPIEWESLERPHNYQSMYNSCLIMQFASFHEYGMDLLYGLPGQTPRTLLDSMDECLVYDPPHMSLYPLQLQPGSRMHACFVEGRTDTGVARNNRQLPTEASKFEMYRQGRAHLLEKGYEQYTLYHFAKPGHRCKYRENMTKDMEQIGLGLGNSSYTDGYLVYNTRDFEAYLAGAGDFAATTLKALELDEKSQMQRMLVNGLHAAEGIRDEDFSARFHRSLFEVYKEKIAILEEKGLLGRQEDRILLTESGVCQAEDVFREL